MRVVVHHSTSYLAHFIGRCSPARNTVVPGVEYTPFRSNSHFDPGSTVVAWIRVYGP